MRRVFLNTRSLCVPALLCFLVAACSDDDTQANNNQNVNGNNNNNNNQVVQCGDGVVGGAEECDEGVSNSDSEPDACRTDCTNARCADGVVDTGEQCDEGTSNSDTEPDACRTDCTNARCGDGVVDTEAGETCDYGSGGPTETCGATCKLIFCGNGIQEAGEVCDDGDNDPGDGCSADCLSLEICGNGYVDTAVGEQCDDGNTDPGDGCSDACQVEACGNSVVNVNEECDDGNHASNDGCTPFCQVEAGWTCHFEAGSGYLCSVCGNSVQEAGEACDDGNQLNGDSCNPTCSLGNAMSVLVNGAYTSLATDETYLWLFDSSMLCQLRRIDIADCLQNGGAACDPAFFAGSACGTPVDGTGAAVVFGTGASIASNGDTLWLGDTHTLREVDIQTGAVTTVAGNPGSCAAVDGIGAAAYMHDPRGLTFFDGYLYLTDACEHVLRRFDPVTQELVTLAGTRVPDPTVTQTPPYSCGSPPQCLGGAVVDGVGSAASFSAPRYTAATFGVLLVANTNGQAIQSYNFLTHAVTTLVGNGLGYADGPVSSAMIERPRGVTADSNGIYWAEQNSYAVRQLTIDDPQEVSTAVGVRGCPGLRPGTGGIGTVTANCGTVPTSYPLLDWPFDVSYHAASHTLFVLVLGVSTGNPAVVAIR